MTHVSVIGAGAWGTALALAALRAGRSVTLWVPPNDGGEGSSSPHENIKHASSISANPPLRITADIKEATETDLMILAPAAQYMRKTCTLIQALPNSYIPLIITSKGIENGSAALMSEVIRDFFPENPLLVLSGPSFAHDVAENLPTAVALAAETLPLSQKIAALLTSPCFHLSPSDDIIGAQIAGALKNIIAIACGIVEGHGFGDNTRAAVLARGLVEIAHLGQAMGGKLETFLGLAGVGDITLTSFSNQSRNKSFGVTVGKGTPLKELLTTKQNLTEGLHTTSGTMSLAKKYRVDMPLTFAMHRFLHEDGNLETIVANLLYNEARA